jgi:hypothetical protein
MVTRVWGALLESVEENDMIFDYSLAALVAAGVALTRAFLG